MKRILQSVALALATLLAVQPALATMTCAHVVCADGHSSPDCCLPSSGASMHGMAMANDAAMPSMNAPGQAPSNFSAEQLDRLLAPCCAIVTRAATPLLASLKSPYAGAVPFARQSARETVTPPRAATATWVDTAPSPPDRQVLFQVFRI